MSTVTLTRRLAVVAAATALMSPSPAFAADEHCAGSGQDYGQLHADLARQGELGQEQNPGEHRGYSSCR